MVDIGSHVNVYRCKKQLLEQFMVIVAVFGEIAGMHQGSALSPLLLVIVMEAISREFRVA